MKTLIIFREGLSGHYFKSLVDDLPVDVNFRMDPWYPGIYDQKTRPEDRVNEDCVCLHNADPVYEQQFDLVLNILVNQKIYHAIYNIFFKKFLIEDIDPEQYKNWKSNLSFWYDKSFYNIKEYYSLLTSDWNNSQYANKINFDNLLDVQYIEAIFKQYYNRKLTDNIVSIVAQYRAKQLEIVLTRDGKTMEEILAVVPDEKFNQSPWFASYCIFKYETNNNLKESQRLWSIDTVDKPIDKKFLLAIADKYQY
jgi:hypothetical protein